MPLLCWWAWYLLGVAHICINVHILGFSIIFKGDHELSLAVYQIIKAQKSDCCALHLCFCMRHSAKQKLLWGIVRTVALWPVFGLRMVTVWLSSEKLWMTDCMSTSKGWPSNML